MIFKLCEWVSANFQYKLVRSVASFNSESVREAEGKKLTKKLRLVTILVCLYTCNDPKYC